MVQVLVEELKEFVDVLQVCSSIISEDSQIEVNSFQEEEKKIIIIGHGLGGHLAW